MIPRLAPAVAGCILAIAASAAPTNGLSDKEIEGRALAQQLLAVGPASNLVQNAILNIRISRSRRLEIPVRIQSVLSETGWQEIYETSAVSNRVRLAITHQVGRPNRYQIWDGPGEPGAAEDRPATTMARSQIMTPFAGSDFWVADLGREFFHWPQQTLLKKVVRSSRGCSVLESANSDPGTNGYSRVLSWIDSENGGILYAEAYDAKGKLLKEYDTKKLKKVNGQWQVQEMEIVNDQTGTRTRLEFDLKSE
ncbi:MAG TPA: outer membrane lipoprotein-sorting protein [Candidatus Acidoferrum sp.]|nr:outer membrane lipoprotein-sorting protein [Candidatus Acidoferrum sp.]